MPREKTLPRKIKAKCNNLHNILSRHRGAVIALSGGVDSSLLAVIAHRVLGEQAIAVTVFSPIHPAEELKLSKIITSRFGIRHIIIKGNELSYRPFASNPVNRCYLCKKMMFRSISSVARRHGYHVIEGSNIDDLNEYRPGLKALKESGVASPFVDAGINKKEIRLLARYYDLPNWQRVANACYATRVPFHQEINLKKIKRIAAAERLLEKLSPGPIRVRDYGQIASIETSEKSLPVIIRKRRSIAKEFRKLGYKHIALDLEGYRSGSLNP